MRKIKTGKRKLTADVRQIEALQLRLRGHSLTAIAQKLGYRQACGASAAILSALDKERQEPAEGVRALEVKRLDALLERLWPLALNRNMQAIDRVFRLMERRARYLGLDAPQRSELSGPAGTSIAQASPALSAELAEAMRKANEQGDRLLAELEARKAAKQTPPA